MPREIERKFIIPISTIIPDDVNLSKMVQVKQAYLSDISSSVESSTVRVRSYKKGESHLGFITVKSNEAGISREEFEYQIPFEEAESMMYSLSVGSIVEKTRILIPYEDLIIELDVFHGDNEGLIIAEVEFEADNIKFTPPSWFGREVTDDFKYFNVNLAVKPYKIW